MAKRTLPRATEASVRAGLRWDLSPRALERWNPLLQTSAQADADNTISILEPIGYDWWTGEGVTAKRISGALRSIGRDKPVTVTINSPGGDMFEGLAIYNLLREHPGDVTVKVVGLAASAASVIAMGGDEIRIARAGFLMVHNCWAMAVGNRHDLRDIAEQLEPFDESMADIYAARSGKDIEEVGALMDAETWIGGSKAVDMGFADALLASDEVTEGDGEAAAARAAAHRLDLALAKSGMPRSERRKLINEIKSGMPGAAGGGTPGATERDMPSAVALEVNGEVATASRQLLSIFK